MKAAKFALLIFTITIVVSLIIADASISQVGKVNIASISKVSGVASGVILSIGGSNVTSIPQYTLTVLQTGNGTVGISPVKAFYTTGETVTLTGTADADYQFYSYDDGSDPGDVIPSVGLESNTLVITMNADTTVTANFAYLISTTVIDGAHGSYGAAEGGCIFSTNYDGDSATPGWITTSTGTVYPNAKYFLEERGVFTSDYPMAILNHGNPTVQNVVFDSDADIDDGNGGSAPSGGSLTVMVRAASALQNCTLNRAHKYGMGFWDTDGALITGCNVTWAQYCMSGSHNVTNSDITWCKLSGMGLVGVKMKDMVDCTIEHNYVDLTPNNYWNAGQAKQGINLSDDTATIHGNVIQDNNFIRVAEGTYSTITTYGMSVDAGVVDVGGNSFINNEVTKPNAAWARMYGVNLATGCDYITVTGNTFTNCYPADDAILGSGAGHCTLTPNTVIP